MRRRWARVAAAIAVLVLALLAGAAALGLATAPAFLSGALTQVLGRHVTIGAIQVKAGLRMQVEIADLQIHETSDPASEVLLEAPRATGWQSWPRVLVGQLVPLSWKADSPVLRVHMQGGASPKLELPAFDLDVSNGRVELTTGEGVFSIEKLRIEAEQSLLTGLRGSADGEVHRGKNLLGRFSAGFSGGLRRARVQGRVARVDLARLGLPESLQLHGTASGQVSLDLQPDAPAATVALDVAGLTMLVPGLGQPIAPQRAQLKGEGRWSQGALSVRLDPLQVDDLVVRGPVNLTSGDDGRLVLSVTMDEFQPGVAAGTRLNPLRMIGLRFLTLQRIHDRFEAGSVVDAKLDVNLALRDLGHSLSFARPLGPDEFHLHLRTNAATFHSPGSEPFKDINGAIDIEGDELRFADVHMNRFGDPLPQIDVAIDGFSRFVNLPGDERYIPKGPGVATPGLGPAVTAMLPPPLAAGARASPDAAPIVVQLSDFRLEHPALLLPIRNATAELRSRDGKLIVDPIRGVVAGGAADMRIEWDRKGQKVAVRLKYDYAAAGTEKRPGPRDEDTWFAGRFALSRLQLGPWPLVGVSGRLSAQQAEIDLSDVTAKVTDGQLAASGEVSLAEEGGAPVALAIDLRNADVAQVANILDFPPETITGRGDARGPIRGRLDPGKTFLPSADIQLDLELRDGTLPRLPEALKLARLPSLQGVLGLFGRAMPYSRVLASFTIRDAVMRTERFTLLGPELRILAAGEMDLKPPEKPTDMIVALLFVQTLDRVIGKVPFLGKLVLGPDESLLAVYLRLQGPWADPQVSLVPPNTISAAADWASRMVGRGLSGLKDLRNLVLPGQGRTAREKEKTKPAVEPGTHGVDAGGGDAPEEGSGAAGEGAAVPADRGASGGP